MKVYLNEITGIADMIISMYFSKRTWTRELENYIRQLCYECTNRDGSVISNAPRADVFNLELNKAIKWCPKHITLGRFMDFSITVEGLHRAGQDDWDAHAKRFDNRIIRSSTRLATYDNEMSDYYKGKILPTDIALAALGITTPEELIFEGQKYVRTTNGYIREDMKDNKDVKRGLYMLSIPSNFIFKIDLTEWSHVYKERNTFGSANPEVKECCEQICDQLESFIPQLTRELFSNIKN